MEKNKIEITSVGVDIGSSTSHLVFSNLVLIRDEKSPSRRFEIEERHILYQGRIVNTPLLDDHAIDIQELTTFLKEEYVQAGIDPSAVHTGAVIVTGESARKHNAPLIVEALSSDAGRFVAATAGPNFESIIAAMGSGAVARSKALKKTILACDIGGGTANMAISRDGTIISTGCVSVGGRVMVLTDEGIIRRLDPPARMVMEHLGLAYRVGDTISTLDLERISDTLAEVLIEAMTDDGVSELTCKLMVTGALDFPERIDEYSFSGGVAELMFGKPNHYNDIGGVLAAHINRRLGTLDVPVVEPENKIRATVIGAGAYSLSISGASCYMDHAIRFPIRNIPVLRVDIEKSQLSAERVVSQIRRSFQRFDLREGEEVVALYFKDPVDPSYSQIERFAKSVAAALPRTIHNNMPIILIFEKDIACGVGNVMRRETRLNTNLLSLDELMLKEGDWIDVGAPLAEGQVFPVTVKSLVFDTR